MDNNQNKSTDPISFPSSPSNTDGAIEEYPSDDSIGIDNEGESEYAYENEEGDEEELDDEDMEDEDSQDEESEGEDDEGIESFFNEDTEGQLNGSERGLPSAGVRQRVGGGRSLDKLQLRIDFRIGEVTMPANELAGLAPGFTLTDLPGLIFPRARALCSGRVFAEGELVDIDGKIGFRITKLLS